MRIFGYEIGWAKAAGGKGEGQLSREASPQGPYTSFFQNYLARKVMPSLYEAMRESIPVIDTAIHKLTTLDGIIRVDGRNKGLVHEIEDWMEGVQVNDMQTGFQAFVNNYTNETYEQGFSISEFVTAPGLSDISRLNVADSKDIRFRRASSGLEAWYRGRSNARRSRDATEQVGDILYGNLGTQNASSLSAKGWEKLNPNNILYYSIANENHNPYGTSVMRSMEFAAKILLTIENGLLNSWERFGDPSYQITYKCGKRDLGTGTLEARRKALATDFNDMIAAKRKGQSADFVQAVDQNSDVEVKIVGADGQVLEVEMPARHVLEQIAAKTGLPPWMLGFHWSTTERLAKYEAEMMLQEAEIRGTNKMPGPKRLVSTMLKLRGRTWKRDDWWLEFERPNLHDLVSQAQARFLNAQADMYYAQNGKPETTDPAAQEKPEKGAKSACGHNHAKEIRPVAWPEVDRVEREYEERLKSGWAELRDRVLAVLGLKGPGKALKGPEDLPGAEKFTFTAEQRSEVYLAMRDWVGAWKGTEGGEKALEWYYGQAYSLGLLQAARMIGAERPVLDIIKNKEVFDSLVSDGFTMVKEGATRAMQNSILPEMEAQMLAGTNPRHVADRLAKLFEDANSNWERLARSEMTMAAERAKLDEARAEGA
ncbi:MAG: hypothetical protein ACE5GY_08535, partial [Thermodesulfobacteriota bacterium]